MWVHESFTNYSESLFVENQYGKQAGQEYVHGTRLGIVNDGPIIGEFNLNNKGSGDMYPKGGNLLNMTRNLINDDEKWRQILRGLNKTFYHQTVTGTQVINYINQQSGQDFTKMYEQYLRHPNIPTLEVRFENGEALGRWVADVPGFAMPVRVRQKGGEYRFVTPTTAFKPLGIAGLTKDNLEVDTFNAYIGVLID